MEDIPEDLRELKDFPVFNSMFQDGPKFRQNLTLWAFKTDKLATSLMNLADSFDRFHSSGLQHFKAATEVVQALQQIGVQLGNNKGNTISGPLQQFSEALNNIWCYYEAFLGQTLMLNAEPLRELANSLTNLKKLYEQLMHFRKEYILAAERLCACRHISRLADKTQFATLTEECYTAHKTYQLVLSKYVLSLRQVNTQEIMNLLRRVIEHLLSLYSYHNFSAQVLKDQEPTFNDLFTKTKEWRQYYEEELEVWNKLHHSVQRHIMAEFQHKMGLVPYAIETSPTWTEVAMAPFTATTQLGKNVFKPILKIFPSHTAHSLTKPEPPSPQWYLVGDDDLEPESPKVRYPLKPQKRRKPVGRTYSIPVMEEDSRDKRRRVAVKDKRKMVKSISDPDILVAQSLEMSNGSIPVHTGMRDERTGSEAQLLRGRRASPSSSSTELLQSSNGHSSSFSSPFRPLAAVLSRSKAKKENKKMLKREGRVFNSLDDLTSPPSNTKSSSGTPTPDGSASSSPALPRKTSKSGPIGVFKRARGSLLHLMTHDSPTQPDQPKNARSQSESSNGVVASSNGEQASPSSPQRQAEEESPDGVIDLQKLIEPIPENWIKCGYLWLRMKLPNNRYAWMYIYCVVDRQLGQLMIQEQSLPEPRKLENLLLCTTKPCTPDFIDRNYCFRVISPSSEHLFQVLNEQQQQSWMAAIQGATAEAIKKGNVDHLQSYKSCSETLEDTSEIVPNAMTTILGVSGNTQCADCSSTEVEWASINLGIVLCIACSGVHRGLGVHVSKVRSLNLDKWDKPTVDFMLSQGNTKSNSYYEAMLDAEVLHADVRKPAANAKKKPRQRFIQQKYVALAFVPEDDDRNTHL